MSAKIIDGKQIAADIRAELKTEVAALKEQGVIPGLGVVLVGDDPASKSYVGAKEKACGEIGIYSDDNRLPADTTQEELLALVEQMNQDPKIKAYWCNCPCQSISTSRRFLWRSIRIRTWTVFTP